MKYGIVSLLLAILAFTLGRITTPHTPTDQRLERLERVYTQQAQVGYMGIFARDFDQDLANATDLPMLRGALIHQIEPHAPAAFLDLRPGDVIVDFAGHPIRNAIDLELAIAQVEPQQKIALSYVRNGQVEHRMLYFTVRRDI